MEKMKKYTIEDVKREFAEYAIIYANYIRSDYCGCHHIGYDAIDASGQYWSVFETEEGYLFLAR